MSAVRMCVRSMLRRRVWSAVAVALLIGIAGGGVMAAYAGARRTESAFPRFLDRTRVVDELILPRQFEGVRGEEIAKLPGVTQVGVGAGLGFGARPGADGFPTTGSAGFITDGALFYDFEKPALVRGRMARPDRVHEVVVSLAAAEALGVDVGSRLQALLFDIRRFSEGPRGDPTEIFTPLEVRVVGVARSVDEILNEDDPDAATVILTPAAGRKLAHLQSFAAIGVRLADPERDLPGFERALARLYPDVQFELNSRISREATFARAVQPYSDALRLFAAVAALTALLVVGQALARVVVADASDGAELEAIGATRAQRAASAAVRALGVTVVGAAIATVVTVALSPVFPLGPARRAELDPGLRVDGLVIGVGVLAILVALGGSIVLGAWRISRSTRIRSGVGDAPWRPARFAEWLGGIGAPASVMNGVRFAMQRNRRTDGGSLATTLVGLVVAVATTGAALAFGANLDRLVTTPERYGWTWDVMLDTSYSEAPPELVAAIADDSDLTELTVGARGTNIRIGGDVLLALGFEASRGSLLPEMVEGRFPRSRREVALGTETLRDLRRSVGDSVAATAADGTALQLRIVGRSVVPTLTLSGFEGIGESVVLTMPGLLRLDPGAESLFYLANIRSGASIAAIERRYLEYGALAIVDGRPADVGAYAGVRSTPPILAGLLALLGAGVLAHLLVTSVRSRRRDLAVLKTLGSSRRQVAATVAWQATTLVGIALAIGIPLGIVAGRWTWRGFAENLGIVETVVIPTTGFVVLLVAGVLFANVIAAIPARTAGRTSAARILRSE